MRFDRRRNFGRFRDRGRYDLPKPVKIGEEYDVEIGEVGAKGDGIARVNNFVVFVANTQKGDKVKIKITDVRDRFAIGEKVGAAEAKEAAETKETVEEAAEPNATEEASEEMSEEAAESEESEEMKEVENTQESEE